MLICVKAEADPGFPRRGGGANPKGGGANLLFWKFGQSLAIFAHYNKKAIPQLC